MRAALSHVTSPFEILSLLLVGHCNTCELFKPLATTGNLDFPVARAVLDYDAPHAPSKLVQRKDFYDEKLGVIRLLQQAFELKENG